MKVVFSSLIMSGMLAGFVFLQPPGGQQGEGRGPRQGGGGPEETIKRVMSLDKNEDGKLTEDEYSESRLKGLVERADADKNKEVTREEVAQLVQKEMGGQGRGFEGGPGGRGRQGGPGGPGGFGGPPPMEGEFGGPGGPGGFGDGPGGQGGPGGRGEMGRGRMGGPMMQPGRIVPEFMMQQLNLSEEQRAKIAKLQETVDAELASILTAEQLQQLKQPMMGRRGGPGGPGGPGFPGGPGGPGGPGFPGGQGGEGFQGGPGGPGGQGGPGGPGGQGFQEGRGGERRRPAGEGDGENS